MVTKADVQKARERYWLKEAQKQLGPHIKSLKQVKVVSKAKKPRYSLGESLSRKTKSRGLGGKKIIRLKRKK
jgi:hypothetical protein